jgi:NTP pyrophosphatase (non-canonical NTP hydrolase)
MASIADAIARNTDDDSYYAVAGEYLDALVTYVGVLNNDMGFSATESVQFVTDKYVGRLAQGDNVGVATFIAASLAALGG